MDLTDYHVNLVKQLKEDTGFGMMDCKKALIINDWNVDKAEKYLVDMEETSEMTRLINRTIED